MLKLEHTEVVGWEAAIRGMRNPLESWEKSDSDYGCAEGHCDDCPAGNFYDWCPSEYDNYEIGPNDHDLMMRLAKGGPVHAKYRRMITVYVDITAPLYWWKEFDTYKVGTVANSCSTMHKIAAKEFTLEDFSHEHLDTRPASSLSVLEAVIVELNHWRNNYLVSKSKEDWWQMIQLLPSSYNQRRTVMLNYEVLANIYKSRRNHKLDEWKIHASPDEHAFRNRDFSSGIWGFCDWIESLPYSELITGPSLKDVPISNEIMEEAKRRVREELDKKEWRKANPKLDELERKSYVRTVEGNKIKYKKG